MKATGMVRDIDKVGRVVIPKEIRTNLGVSEGDPLEIFVNGGEIILRKYEPSCIFCKSAEEVITYEEKKICRKCLDKLKNL